MASSSVDRHICKVGYAFNGKKMRKSGSGKESSHVTTNMVWNGSSHGMTNIAWNGGGIGDIITGGGGDDIVDDVQFISWDWELAIAQQPVFDVFIHKLTEDINNEESKSKMTALEEYLRTHPETVVIDPVVSVQNVISRAQTCELLRRTGGCCSCSGGSHSRSFAQPNYVIVNEDISNESIFLALQTAGMRFPVICKPVLACGKPESHQMAVIVSVSDLHLIPRPAVVQQYHNHGSKFLKVYVMGEDVMVFERPSLPDIPLSNLDAYRSVVFDSRLPYPTVADFFINGTARSNSALSGIEKEDCSYEARVNGYFGGVPMSRFREAAERIRDAFGLSLFGFDVIAVPRSALSSSHRSGSYSGSTTPDAGLDVAEAAGCEGGGAQLELMVIDVNFFPSYKEVVDFPSRLRRFLKSRRNRNEKMT